jgi:hypothetical protein
MDNQITIMEVMIARLNCVREAWMRYDAYSGHMAYKIWNFLIPLAGVVQLARG